jgi:hypothetical protein
MFLRNVGAYIEPHGIFISQKTAFFVVTAVKTSDLTHTPLLHQNGGKSKQCQSAERQLWISFRDE